jgi:hypothetical protein
MTGCSRTKARPSVQGTVAIDRRHIDGVVAALLREGKVRVLQFIAITWLAFVCGLAPALADRRVALVIGNAAYRAGVRNGLGKAVTVA